MTTGKSSDLLKVLLQRCPTVLIWEPDLTWNAKKWPVKQKSKVTAASAAAAAAVTINDDRTYWHDAIYFLCDCYPCNEWVSLPALWLVIYINNNSSLVSDSDDFKQSWPVTSSTQFNKQSTWSHTDSQTRKICRITKCFQSLLGCFSESKKWHHQTYVGAIFEN